MSFRALNLSPQILQAIDDAGYTEPTPIQVAAIPPVLAGHDVIGIAQTGTGKTAAFVWPILMKLLESKPTSSQGHNGSRHHQSGSGRGPRALVVAPTRELVVQIEENVRIYAKHISLRMATVYGGVSERPQIAALRSGVDLVVATPGRLIDLMDQRVANLSSVEFLVLDEADRMLDMGFLPPIRRIVKALPQKRQTLMFSATLSHEIEKLTHEFQRSPKIIEIGRRANPAETVTQFVYEVRPHLKAALLMHLLGDPAFDTVLVFTRTKRGADKIARRLEGSGIKTGTIHSNRSQNQRLRALKDFKSGAVRVLVATDIAARGIDVDGISHVVNYDFPMQSEITFIALGARAGRMQSGTRSASSRRKIRGRCVRLSVSSGAGSSGKKRKVSITIRLRRRGTSEVGAGNAERRTEKADQTGEIRVRRKSSRDCRETLREAAVRRSCATAINFEMVRQIIAPEEGPIGGTAD